MEIWCQIVCFVYEIWFSVLKIKMSHRREKPLEVPEVLQLLDDEIPVHRISKPSGGDIIVFKGQDKQGQSSVTYKALQCIKCGHPCFKSRG